MFILDIDHTVLGGNQWRCWNERVATESTQLRVLGDGEGQLDHTFDLPATTKSRVLGNLLIKSSRICGEVVEKRFIVSYLG